MTLLDKRIEELKCQTVLKGFVLRADYPQGVAIARSHQRLVCRNGTRNISEPANPSYIPLLPLSHFHRIMSALCTCNKSLMRRSGRCDALPPPGALPSLGRENTPA